MRDYWDRAIRPGFTSFGIHSGTEETCADCIPVEPGVPHPSEMGEASHARARADRSFAPASDTPASDLVFGPRHTEVHMAQNEDNRAHLAYYDKPNEVSFVFNQSGGTLVSVCPGGYAEPEQDTFEWDYDLPLNHPVLDDFLRSFEDVCRAYIREHYGVPAVVSAFRAGLEGRPDDRLHGNLATQTDMPLVRAYLAGQNIRTDLGLNEDPE